MEARAKSCQLAEQVIDEKQHKIGGKHCASLGRPHEKGHVYQHPWLSQDLVKNYPRERAPLQEILQLHTPPVR